MNTNKLTLQNYWTQNGKSILLQMCEENIKRRKEERYQKSKKLNDEYIQGLIKTFDLKEKNYVNG